MKSGALYLGLLLVAPILSAQTTVAQFSFGMTGITFGPNTSAEGFVYFKDNDQLWIEIANTSSFDSQFSDFWIFDPTGGTSSIAGVAPSVVNAQPGWIFESSLDNQVKNAGGFNPTLADYFGASVKPNSIDEIPDDDTLPYTYQTFKFQFDVGSFSTPGNLTTALANFSTSNVPLIYGRWQSVVTDSASGESDKGVTTNLSQLTVIAVPEPSAIGLLGFALCGALLVSRRRFKR